MAWLLFLVACGGSVDPALGTWEGKTAFDQSLTLKLREGGAMQVKIGDAVHSGTWAIDRSQDPMHFDLDLDDRDPIHTVVAFPSADTLVYEDITSSDARPAALGDAQLELKRR